MRWLLVVLVLVGCDLAGPEVEYVNRRPMEPAPAVYSELHAQVIRCLGTEHDFRTIGWFVADSIFRDGRPLWGHADLRGFITIRTDHVRSGPSVRHELEHVIRRVGDEAHDRDGHLLCEVDAVS